MSVFYDSENYELAMTTDIDTLLSELPFDLIKESIIEQIDDPMSTSVNYIDVIVDKCNAFIEMHADDEDMVRQVNENLRDFFLFVITTIDNKFDLRLDTTYIAESESVVDVGMTIYQYFILRYAKNIAKFITKFIVKNRKRLADEFSDTTKKDVSTLALKKQIKNRDDLVIVSNLPSIIKYIFSLDIDPEEFITLNTGHDNYDGVLLVDLIRNNHMVGNFVQTYIDACMDEHDYILDEIQTDIKMRIMKKISE